MNWRYNTIWFEQLDKSRVVTCDLRTNALPSLEKKEYVILRGYRQKNGLLDAFPVSDSVLYLELSFSGIRSFDGIGCLKSLRRLELSHCYKLESDSGLVAVSSSLRHLHINQSKRFKIGQGVRSLRDIEVLRLNSCGEIEDLDFLHDFPRLLDFRFVDTNVRNGDLSPLISHKTLRSVGFLDRKHYSLKAEEVNRQLEAKPGPPFQEYVSKGQWRTFRFISARDQMAE